MKNCASIICFILSFNILRQHTYLPKRVRTKARKRSFFSNKLNKIYRFQDRQLKVTTACTENLSNVRRNKRRVGQLITWNQCWIFWKKITVVNLRACVRCWSGGGLVYVYPLLWVCLHMRPPFIKKSPPISITYPKHHTFSVQSNPHSSKPLVNDNLL